MSFVATPDLEVICVVVLVVTFAFNGGTNAGHIQNIIGLAPNRSQCSSLWCLSSNQSILHRSGTLYGFTNGFGNISGYLVPEIKKQIVKVPLDIFIIKHDHYISISIIILIIIIMIISIIIIMIIRTRQVCQNGGGSSSSPPVSTWSPPSSSPFAPLRLSRSHFI